MTVVGLSAPAPVALAFSNINHVVASLDQAMAVVDALTDEDQLCDLWHAMDAIGSKAWMVRAKISYVIVERIPSQQGRTDADDSSRVAAIERLAAYLGCSPSTLWEDCRLYRLTLAPLLTLESGVGSGANGITETLREKGFYQTAARTPDPVATLESFAQRKDANPFYEAEDAKRDAQEEIDRQQFAAHAEELPALGANTVNPLTGLGLFNVILADPPWRYQSGTTTPDRQIEVHYPTMALDEICNVPVPACCHDDAILFLWSPSPKVEEALSVLNAWGFAYRASMVWVKPQIGMGHWVRSQHELLLIGRRGNMPTPAFDRRPASVIDARRGRHSAKPEFVYGLIEAMYPGCSYLELFARQRREGWTSWGDEVPCHLQHRMAID